MLYLLFQKFQYVCLRNYCLVPLPSLFDVEGVAVSLVVFASAIQTKYFVLLTKLNLFVLVFAVAGQHIFDELNLLFLIAMFELSTILFSHPAIMAKDDSIPKTHG